MTVKFLILGGIACIIISCAGSRNIGQSKPNPHDSQKSFTDSLFDKPRDSVSTLNLQLKHLDSNKAPEKIASELYLLTLDNFLKTAPNDPRVIEIRMWKANQLYNQKNYSAAIAAYKDFSNRYPKSTMVGDANQMIAQAFERQGNHKDAENWYQQMLQDSNVTVRKQAEERIAQSIYMQGEEAEKEGSYLKSSEAYARVAKAFPKSEIAPTALFNSGVMAEKIKDWKRAIELYKLFFNTFYESPILPKVLFREAKCREMNSEFKIAGEKYRNLAHAHQQSSDAELALYNAGFAFASAGDTLEAAKSFAEYAERYPDKLESPNLLSRAVESYGALKNWEKVADLQTQFAKRYGGSKTRLVQALSMSGLAEAQQGHEPEAKKFMRMALAEFTPIKNPDANARYYAAQAYQFLGDIELVRMRNLPIQAVSITENLKAKRNSLRNAMEFYLSATELKIVDGVLLAGIGMAQAFRSYGDQAFEGLRLTLIREQTAIEKFAIEEEAFEEKITSYIEATSHYARILTLARKQNINNRAIENSRIDLQLMLRSSLQGLHFLDSLSDMAYPYQHGNIELTLSSNLTRAQRKFEASKRSLEWFGSVLSAARDLKLDSLEMLKLKSSILCRYKMHGEMFQGVVDSSRSAVIPSKYDSAQAFFYQAKLLREILSSVEIRSAEIFTSGILFAEKNQLSHQSETIQLRNALGRALFSGASAYDYLSEQALKHPPFPKDLVPAQRKPFEKKFEEIGYALQDSSIKRHRFLVHSAVQNLASEEWAMRSFATLCQIEPDQWQQHAIDTIFEWNSGQPWQTIGVEKDSTALRSMSFKSSIPWSIDADSILISSNLARKFLIRLDSDTVLQNIPDTIFTKSISKMLSPRKKNMPLIEWIKGKTIFIETNLTPFEARKIVFQIFFFGPAGPNSFKYPWNQKTVTDSELEFLRKTPFYLPNFSKN